MFTTTSYNISAHHTLFIFYLPLILITTLMFILFIILAIKAACFTGFPGIDTSHVLFLFFKLSCYFFPLHNSRKKKRPNQRNYRRNKRRSCVVLKSFTERCSAILLNQPKQ